MEHALRNWIVLHDLTDPQGMPFVMYVGPDFSGRLLEVGVNSDDEIVHAMPARAKYLPRVMQDRRK